MFLSSIAVQAQVFQRIEDASMIMNGAYSQWLFAVHAYAHRLPRVIL